VTLNLLAVSGSLRSGSFCTRLANAAGSLVPDGAHYEVADLVRGLPLYDQDLDVEAAPEPVMRVRDRLAVADGVLLITPEYNYGVPGGLKNLVDWASRPFGKHCLVGKPVAVVGCGPSSRGGRASVEYLRMVLPALGALLVGDEVLLPKIDQHLDPDSGAASDEVAAPLRATLLALADAARTPAG
jgi:chromate reductase